MREIKLKTSDNLGEKVESFIEYLNDSGYSKKAQHSLTKIIIGPLLMLRRNIGDEFNYSVCERVDGNVSTITISMTPCVILEKINEYYAKYSTASKEAKDKMYMDLLVNTDNMFDENDFEAYEIAVKANRLKPTQFLTKSNNEATVIILTFSLN